MLCCARRRSLWPAPHQFNFLHWLFTPRRDTLRRMIKIANSGVVNFISWHRAEFRPARGRSISSSGETAAASVGSDVRFVTKTAKPSARESAGGFAFVPPTCRMGQNRRAKKKWCSAAAAFLRRQNAELQTPHLKKRCSFLLALCERATPYEASTRRG